MLILTYLTMIAGKDVTTWCELRFLSFASKKKRYINMNILILFYKNANVNIWKTLSLCILCEKLGMFQNDMMSYDSTLFHGTLTN